MTAPTMRPVTVPLEMLINMLRDADSDVNRLEAVIDEIRRVQVEIEDAAATARERPGPVALDPSIDPPVRAEGDPGPQALTPSIDP